MSFQWQSISPVFSIPSSKDFWLVTKMSPMSRVVTRNLSPTNCHQPVVTTYKSPSSRCQQHLIDPVLSLMILLSYLRRLLHKKSGRWVWCCPILQAFIKKDWEGESCSISFYIHCLLHLLLGLLYGLVKWTSNMDWQPKNNILRTRGWIWERIAYHDWSANQKNATKSLKTAILTD